jgi:hypothetical protein
LSNLLLFTALVFIVAGSSLPAIRRLRGWCRDYRDLRHLRPLWFSLTEATPAVRLDPPRSARAEALSLRNTQERLYRRTFEIRDALLVLGDHASSSLRDRARAHVQAAGLIGAQAEVTAEACWLLAAKYSRQLNESPSGEHHLPASGGRDLTSEIQALRQLATAYDSDIAKAVAPGRGPSRTMDLLS